MTMMTIMIGKASLTQLNYRRPKSAPRRLTTATPLQATIKMILAALALAAGEPGARVLAGAAPQSLEDDVAYVLSGSTRADGAALKALPLLAAPGITSRLQCPPHFDPKWRMGAEIQQEIGAYICSA